MVKEATPQPTGPTWADAHPSSVLKAGEAAAGQQASAGEARKVCRSIKAGVLDYWCNTQCNGGSACPSNVCSCDGDAEVQESKPLPTAPTWADAHAQPSKGAPTAPTWAEAHAKTTKGAPTWDEAHAKTTKGAPTWDDAHPTTAKQMGAEVKKTIVCRALDNSVTESWCRNSCSSGGHCPKICQCGPSEDFLTRLREEYHEEPQPARVAALSARQQGAEEAPKKKCRSLKPSVMDYWCDTQCADGLKCPTNVCSCDGSVQLRETSKGAPMAPTWEDAHPSKAKHEVDTRTPKIDIVCKSLSPSVSEHWCRTTCLSGSHCPKDCACGDLLRPSDEAEGQSK